MEISSDKIRMAVGNADKACDNAEEPFDNADQPFGRAAKLIKILSALIPSAYLAEKGDFFPRVQSLQEICYNLEGVPQDSK